MIEAVLAANAAFDSLEGGAKVGRDVDNDSFTRPSEKKVVSKSKRSASCESSVWSTSSHDLALSQYAIRGVGTVVYTYKSNSWPERHLARSGRYIPLLLPPAISDDHGIESIKAELLFPDCSHG